MGSGSWWYCALSDASFSSADRLRGVCSVYSTDARVGTENFMSRVMARTFSCGSSICAMIVPMLVMNGSSSSVSRLRSVLAVVAFFLSAMYGWCPLTNCPFSLRCVLLCCFSL